MGKLPDTVLQWLFRVLQPEYLNPVLAYQDASLILMVYSFLKVRTSIHVNVQGKDELLLKIYGGYEHNNEQIPIEIWLPFDYPRSPPLIYVQNAIEGYKLTPNNYFDSNGRFYHPFLSTWIQSYGNDASNDNVQPKDNRMLKLMEVFIHALKHYSPFNKVDPTPSPPPAPALPALPPKPTIRHPVVIMDQSPVTSEFALGSVSGGSKDPSPSPSASQVYFGNVAQSSMTTGISNSNINTPVSSSPLRKFPVVRIPAFDEQQSQKSSPANPAPLLPPNPNRIQVLNNLKISLEQAKIATIQDFNNEVMPQLTQLQNRLLQLNESYVNDSNYLSFLESKLKENEELLKYKTAELQGTLTELDSIARDKLPFIDSYLIAETPVYNQLYNLVCQYEALNDLNLKLEHLNDVGKLEDIDLYLKWVRQLAREQCSVKLHIDKLVDCCGLAKVDF
ncbi:unnamed protein product [Ambrosiozyma monospora]|uniref:Unnamed protein product n=1 Tax=Ambrosiozyma monospora TaxID=43982 RepID=A0A9W6Z2K6_AMBMO|nr:unnamed protein product [Ambrosiozyma monospora]